MPGGIGRQLPWPFKLRKLMHGRNGNLHRSKAKLARAVGRQKDTGRIRWGARCRDEDAVPGDALNRLCGHVRVCNPDQLGRARAGRKAYRARKQSYGQQPVG
jgi:hypothetical protein